MNETNRGVALVTGASSGIGQATAKALQTAGFRVFGTSRRAAAGRSDGIARDAAPGKRQNHQHELGAGAYSGAILGPAE